MGWLLYTLPNVALSPKYVTGWVECHKDLGIMCREVKADIVPFDELTNITFWQSLS